MKVNRNDLLAVLSKVTPGLAKKEIVEQMAHIIFTKEYIATYNDMICIIHPFECDIEFSVKGDEFFKLLNGISESEITLELSDGNILVKSKGTKAKLSTVVGESAKVQHLVSAIRSEISVSDFYKPLPQEFSNGTYLCSFAANKDLATGARSCVAIKDDGVYAADNIRASMYVMDKAMSSMLLPAKTVAELAKYNAVEYGITENWVHFRNKDGVNFSSKMMKGDYPFDAVSSIFSDNEPILQFPKELKDLVSSVTMFAEGDIDINKMISVKITKNLITLFAEKERGSIEKYMAFEYTGEPISFLINPIFFTQVLNYATNFVLAGEHTAQFVSDNFYHILSLPMED